MMSFSFDLGGAVFLLLCFLFFCGLLLWVVRPGSKKLYRKLGAAPLDDGEKNQETGGKHE
jgi:cbb3-type cytochrome oxidase subunit 3